MVLVLGCGSDPADPGRIPGAGAAPIRDAGAEPAAPVAGADYWAAFLDEVVAGDLAAARAGYERELGRSADTPALAARAALRLAELEGAAGNRRRALELVARATAVSDDEAVQDAAERLRGRLVAAPSGAGDLRGPAAGTALPGAAAETAAAFAAAEATLARVHRIRLEPVLEALSTTVRAKERATEAAARAYRAVADAGGLARVAAQYRIGSLYHDLAIELVFDLPPELEAGVASRLRRTLRASALGYLRKAAAAYRISLAEPMAGASGEVAEAAALWRSAAQSDLRAAEELLRGG